MTGEWSFGTVLGEPIELRPEGRPIWFSDQPAFIPRGANAIGRALPDVLRTLESPVPPLEAALVNGIYAARNLDEAFGLMRGELLAQRLPATRLAVMRVAALLNVPTNEVREYASSAGRSHTAAMLDLERSDGEQLECSVPADPVNAREPEYAAGATAARTAGVSALEVYGSLVSGEFTNPSPQDLDRLLRATHEAQLAAAAARGHVLLRAERGGMTYEEMARLNSGTTAAELEQLAGNAASPPSEQEPRGPRGRVEAWAAAATRRALAGPSRGTRRRIGG